MGVTFSDLYHRRAMIVMEELIRIVWGPNDEVMPVPISFMGSWIFLMWWYRSILSLLLS